MAKRQSPTPTLAQLRKLDEMSEEVKCICGSGLYNERHKDRQVPHATNCPKYSPAPQVSCPVPDAPNVPGCQKSDNPELRKWLYHAPTCPDAKPAPQAEDGGKVEERPACAVCGSPATCVGAYEMAAEETYGCDDCCGHGNEDGNCVPVRGVCQLEGMCPSNGHHPLCKASKPAPAPEPKQGSEEPRTAAGDGDLWDKYQAVRLNLQKEVWASQAVARDLEAERDSLRAEVAKLRKFVSEAMHEADAEKARADKAEQSVDSLETMLVRFALTMMPDAHEWTDDLRKELENEGRAILRAREQKEGGR